MENIMKAPARTRYMEISELGSRFNLAFSSVLNLGNKTIALDGIKKKLLVLDNNNNKDLNCIIDLDEVKTIWLKKSYNSITPGEYKEKGLEGFQEAILLQFEYRDEGRSFSLPFYEQGKNELSNLPMLARNARNWQMILSKMISPNKRSKGHDK